MPACHTQQSSRGSQRSTRSSQCAASDLTDQGPIPRITLRLARNPATDGDIGSINEGTQSEETQLNDTQEDEIETSHEQASIELGTSNFDISDLNMKSVKSVSKIKIFVFIEALVRKDQILGNSKLVKFNQFFSVHLLCEKYMQ